MAPAEKTREMAIDRPTTLYRLFDSAHVLLYIGIADRWTGRLGQHYADKAWFPEVTSVTVEHYPDRQAADAAERAAIISERPRHNIVHNRGANRPAATTAGRSGKAPTVRALLEPGDVVALGLDDGRCMIGSVHSTDTDGELVRLDLYSWLTGYFGYEQAAYFIGDIREIRFAQPARHHDWNPAVLDGATVYDMDPLGDFQRAWKQAHEQ